MKYTLTIPNDLSEITLGQYQHYLKIRDKIEDQSYLMVKMVEIFCDVPYKDALRFRASDLMDAATIINEMFDAKHPVIPRFKMHGVEYGMIPELDDMSFGEYIDLDTYLGDWDNIHKAMNALYRPVKLKQGQRYIVEDYNSENPEKMVNMPMSAVLGSVVFFYNIAIELSNIMINYSDQMEETNLVDYLHSMPNGDGINRYGDWLTEILNDLKISVN